MEIRKSKPEDIEDILNIYKSARQYMIKNGNPDQWINGYPDEKSILKDIENNHHFVCVDDNRLVGCFTCIDGDDPTYKTIIKGNWLDNKPYATIHRIAVVEQGKGVGTICIDWCFNRYNNIRVDTHEANISMRKLLDKNGFQYCGIIFNSWDDERLAFQKNMKEKS
jgi:RimJ/RimL family protein N-acetyltransferase